MLNKTEIEELKKMSNEQIENEIEKYWNYIFRVERTLVTHRGSHNEGSLLTSIDLKYIAIMQILMATNVEVNANLAYEIEKFAEKGEWTICDEWIEWKKNAA